MSLRATVKYSDEIHLYKHVAYDNLWVEDEKLELECPLTDYLKLLDAIERVARGESKEEHVRIFTAYYPMEEEEEYTDAKVENFQDKAVTINFNDRHYLVMKTDEALEFVKKRREFLTERE